MNRTIKELVLRVALSLAFCISTAFAGMVEYQMVAVGDPGNATSSYGYGAVNYQFQIGKFEWTNSQYVAFLNAVDPDGTNQASLYNEKGPLYVFTSAMGKPGLGGISFNAGNAAGSKYGLFANMGNKPVNYINWFNAARVANWMHHGALSYATSALGATAIDDGAYELNGATSGTTPNKRSSALFWIPTEDEWFKAAYYKGGGTNAGYWQTALRTDDLPHPVTATATGDGYQSTPAWAYISANVNYTAGWDGGAMVTVGTSGGASVYGTYDQTGNLEEWIDVGSSSSQFIRGGGFDKHGGYIFSNSRYSVSSDRDYLDYGFRLASTYEPSPVPEPSTLVIGSILGLGGYLGRRRSQK